MQSDITAKQRSFRKRPTVQSIDPLGLPSLKILANLHQLWAKWVSPAVIGWQQLPGTIIAIWRFTLVWRVGAWVCHTINPRLSPELLVYVINHAEDRVLFVDKTFLPIAVALKDKLNTLKAVVLMSGRDEEAASQLEGLHFYDELIQTGDDDYVWPNIDENEPSSLCYTSGTTGNPKGVL